MQHSPEPPLQPENETGLFDTYVSAEGEVTAILKEMRNISAHRPQNNAAAQLALEAYASRLEEASSKARLSLDRWLSFVREREVRNEK